MKEGKGFSSSPPRRVPARIRKPNPRIFGTEDAESETYLYSGSRSYKRQRLSTPVPTSTLLPGPDKKAAQAIGVRLRNLLKLPKAHKWVCYEWFYANIDEQLFLGENDFSICVRETFPGLKTRKLRRPEWCKIRRLMGKPRRCSAAFFAEERATLQKRREKIRHLQQRKSVLSIDFKDLPEEIPMTLVIGTKVTARLRKPQDGLFTGVIDALDTINNTYRITFDKPGLGSHSIPDIEVLSNEPQETIPASAFQTRTRHTRPTLFSPAKFSAIANSSGLVSDNDPLLGSSPQRGSIGPGDIDTLGGFPIKFLVLVTRLTKILAIKKDKIKQLKEMNTQSEKLKTFGSNFDPHFQQTYAAAVLELEKLNKELNTYLVGVQEFSQEVAPDHGIAPSEQPSEIRRRCEKEGNEMVRRTNISQGRKMVKSERMLHIISRLTSLLLQVRTFSETDMHSFEFKSLQESLNDIKETIDPSNIGVFEDSVEIHINHIQSGLTQLGNLHAFAASAATTLGF